MASPFLSVAFPTGLVFMIAGVVECLSYSSYRGDNEERTWILIDGTTTFMLWRADHFKQADRGRGHSGGAGLMGYYDRHPQFVLCLGKNRRTQA